jgi:hypothetical protein
MSMKNSNDTIGNRIRELPPGSAMSHSTAPPRAPQLYSTTVNTSDSNFKFAVKTTSDQLFLIYVLTIANSNFNANCRQWYNLLSGLLLIISRNLAHSLSEKS